MLSIHRLRDELHRVERAALYCSDAQTRRDLSLYLNDIRGEIDRQSRRDHRPTTRSGSLAMGAALAM